MAGLDADTRRRMFLALPALFELLHGNEGQDLPGEIRSFLIRNSAHIGAVEQPGDVEAAVEIAEMIVSMIAWAEGAPLRVPAAVIAEQPVLRVIETEASDASPPDPSEARYRGL